VHGDTIHWSSDGPATPASARLDGGENLRTSALSISFLCIDSTGQHDTGEPVEWKNTITLKERLYQDGGQRRCELQAYPSGAIRYTIDGSGPEAYGAAYTGPFVVPEGTRYVLAVAEAQGIKSDLLTIDVPAQGKDPTVTVDATKPATWKRKFRLDSTAAAFEWLQFAEKHKAGLGGITLQVVHGQAFVEFRADTNTLSSGTEATAEATHLKEIIPPGNLDLEVEILQFATGQQLLDMVADLKTELQAGEVFQ
jgi:hypothetical protein